MTNSAFKKIIAFKSQKRLIAYFGDTEFLSTPAVFGKVDDGPKRERGDLRTPEGLYALDYKKTWSGFYKSIHINYPTPNQIQTALSLGIDPGDEILLHGPKLSEQGEPIDLEDATDGCIAVSKEAMDALWAFIEPGTPLIIEP